VLDSRSFFVLFHSVGLQNSDGVTPGGGGS